MEIKVTKLNAQMFKVDSDDLPYLNKEFSWEASERVYDYRTKKLEWRKVMYHLYTNIDIYGCYFMAGFAPYILYHYGDKMDEESKEVLKSYIYADYEFDFDGLRDYQIADVKEMMKFKRGLFSVYTGYGKTQIIAKLIDYVVNVRKEKILVIAPSSKALEEIQLRVQKVCGLTSSYFDYNALYNAINTNGFLRSGSYNRTEPYWKEVKWLIADECEYCLSDSAAGMMDLLINLEYCYGFSGTADKSGADRIVMRQGSCDVVHRNKALIDYFGFSIVYRRPNDFQVELINIKTSMFNDLTGLRISNEGEVYSEVILDLFTDKRFCEGLMKIVEKEKDGIYIPMGRLEVIYHWLNYVFVWKNGKIANICGDGIQIWSEGALVEHIDLEELKRRVENGEIEVIVGTQSSYRAIDLPKLYKILPLTSRVASAVIQQIGRVARGRKFQIFNLVPSIYVTIYSSDMKERMKLIKTYYADCQLTEVSRRESEYGIF